MARAGILLMLLVLTTHCDAYTLHRSFRTREIGYGGVGVAVPVDSRISKAIDASNAKEAMRTRVMIGRVTRTIGGDSFCMVTGGGSKVNVRMQGLSVTDDAAVAAVHLKKMIQGRQVRIEFQSADEDGFLRAKVFMGKIEINQRLQDLIQVERSEFKTDVKEKED